MYKLKSYANNHFFYHINTYRSKFTFKCKTDKKTAFPFEETKKQKTKITAQYKLAESY